MSELRERRWSVMSERGCEASSLSYDEAIALEDKLRGEKVFGLCIITDEAARHLPGKTAKRKTKRNASSNQTELTGQPAR